LSPDSLRQRWTGTEQWAGTTFVLDGALDSRVFPFRNGDVVQFTPTFRRDDIFDSVGVDILGHTMCVRLIAQGDAVFAVYDCSQKPWKVIAARHLPRRRDVSFSALLTHQPSIVRIDVRFEKYLIQATLPWHDTDSFAQLRLTATSLRDELLSFTP
jgi:hypothetical protein